MYEGIKIYAYKFVLLRHVIKKKYYLCTSNYGEMAEWSIAAVLKTVDCNRSGGSNPSFSAIKGVNQ